MEKFGKKMMVLNMITFYSFIQTPIPVSFITRLLHAWYWVRTHTPAIFRKAITCLCIIHIRYLCTRLQKDFQLKCNEISINPNNFSCRETSCREQSTTAKCSWDSTD